MNIINRLGTNKPFIVDEISNYCILSAVGIYKSQREYADSILAEIFDNENVYVDAEILEGDMHISLWDDGEEKLQILRFPSYCRAYMEELYENFEDKLRDKEPKYHGLGLLNMN